MGRSQLDLNENSETIINNRLKPHELFLGQSRRITSAPAYTGRRLSTNSSKLQSIEENDEHGSIASSIISSKSSNKVLKDTVEKWDMVTEREEQNKLTPRCIEVPPKKICVRDGTPEFITRQTDIPKELDVQIRENWKGNGNKRFTVGNREFILRKVNKINIACASTQTKSTPTGERNCDHSSFYTRSSRSRSFEAGDFPNTDQASHHTNVRLPQSVEEIDLQPITLEPNIIIIDTDEEKKRSKIKRKKIGAVGDAFINFGNLSMEETEKDNAIEDVCKNTLNDIIKPFERCMPSRSCTPTYVMSTVYSDSTLPGSIRKSDGDSVPEITPKYYSNTEVIEREIRTINPATSDTIQFGKVSESRSEVFDVGSYKTILMDYSSGIKPTRSFPIHFDDLETLETKEEESNIVRFKQKASECLQSANSRLRQLSTQLDPSALTVETERRSQTSKNASIIDTRKNQQIDLSYYLVGSSSESSIISEQGDEPSSPGIKPSEIQWEQEEESGCCSCFGSLRLV